VIVSARNHLAAVSAGAIAANVIPHLAHGVTGKPFPTPFANPPGVGDSSPALNIVWAGMNAVGAGLVVFTERRRASTPAFVLSFALGATVAALGLRSYFGQVRGQR
jgi:hypothetical protein